MKPENLKYPFKWSERHMLLRDKILYVPDYLETYEDFIFPGWDSSEVFGNNNPVFIEYCSGNGHWIIEQAKKNPDQNWVAVELKFERVRKIWSKIQNEGITNLFIVSGEALTTTRNYLPSDSVAGIYINFPDPWPKKKHAKHRLFQPPFVEQMWRILSDDSTLTLVTDDAPYSDQAIEEMLAYEGFRSGYPDKHYGEVPGDYGSSYFDALWRRLGRDIRHHQFHKEVAVHAGNDSTRL